MGPEEATPRLNANNITLPIKNHNECKIILIFASFGKNGGPYANNSSRSTKWRAARERVDSKHNAKDNISTVV